MTMIQAQKAQTRKLASDRDKNFHCHQRGRIKLIAIPRQCSELLTFPSFLRQKSCHE